MMMFAKLFSISVWRSHFEDNPNNIHDQMQFRKIVQRFVTLWDDQYSIQEPPTHPLMEEHLG